MVFCGGQFPIPLNYITGVLWWEESWSTPRTRSWRPHQILLHDMSIFSSAPNYSLHLKFISQHGVNDLEPQSWGYYTIHYRVGKNYTPWGIVLSLFPLAYSSTRPSCLINCRGIFWMKFPSKDRIVRDLQLQSCHGNHSSLLFMTFRSLKFVRFSSSEENNYKCCNHSVGFYSRIRTTVYKPEQNQ